jgi:hypothetical protein
MHRYLVTGIFAFMFSSQAYSQSVERICSTCVPRNDGDFVHRSDSLTPGWIGHAGIKITPKNLNQSAIYDVNTGRPKGRAIQGITFNQFVEDQPFWGAKRSSRMDARRLDMLSIRVSLLLRGETEYDGNHSNQKGQFFQRGDGTQYFEADCVGFVEGIHEGTGDDLTPNVDEGIILSVQTQRDRSFSFDVGGW